jgi:hypothetical protein
LTAEPINHSPRDAAAERRVSDARAAAYCAECLERSKIGDEGIAEKAGTELPMMIRIVIKNLLIRPEARP